MDVTGRPDVVEPPRTRRSYDSSLRRARAADTRDRIASAGCELLQGASIRDWRGLTIRAVAERAGVNERTVYRHFTNERGLRDEIMRRLERQAGIDLDGLRLDDVVSVTARIFESVAAHPLEPRPPLDPTLTEAGRREREALRRAVAPHTEGWSDADRTVAAAMFDVLWGVAAYERLAVDWGLDRDDAITGITWVIELIERAVREGRPPGAGTTARPPSP